MLLEHNKEVYAQLENTLLTKKKNCAIVVMGTGVGKTYVTKEFLENNDLRALIVSPRRSINEAWKKTCGERIDAVTYQKLARLIERNQTIDLKGYDVVVCDEVHHIGAPKWGQAIDYIINTKKVKVIGLTENSVRYTDGCRDVGVEYFASNFCYGESVASAIEKKVLNSVTYIGAIYNTDGIREKVKGRVSEKLYSKLDIALNNMPSVHEIIKENLPTNRKNKGIIFAPTIEEIREAIKFVREVCPNVEIREIHSKQSEVLNSRNLKWFNEVEEGFLCSVDMLSEGIHLKGVNTLFMLRRTASPSVFSQQLGRCLSATVNSNNGISVTGDTNALVFDLVNNKFNIKVSASAGLSIKVPSIFDERAINNAVKSEQIIIKDYSCNLVEVLNEVKDSLEPYWTEEEKKIVAHYWAKEHGAVSKRLPRHTPGGCKYMAKVLGLVREGWSEESIQFLKDNYSKMTVKEIAKCLGKSEQAVYVFAQKHKEDFNLERKKSLDWTEEEDEILRKYYPKMGGAQLFASGLLPGRSSRKTIIVRARTLGLVYSGDYNKPWTEDEDRILRDNYIHGGIALVCKLIPTRSKKAIQNRVRLLSLNKPLS